MKEAKRQKLEAAGWKIGSAAVFLELTEEEESLVEMKLALADKLKASRRKRMLTQSQVAKRIGSSQSRIAKMEVADGSVSLDLLVRALLALGINRRDIARALGAQISKGRANRSADRRRLVAR
jgi:hypothetical protein